MKPRLLDLFCGAGGAAMGYARAGFEVVGVDIKPQPNYPFEFIQADAMTFPLDGFDWIHASPPCQAFTAYKRRPDHVAPRENLIARVRDRFNAMPLKRYVIENVRGAPLWAPFKLCGSSFSLDVQRHRYFEMRPGLTTLEPPCSHRSRRKYAQATNRKNKRCTVEIGVWRIPLEMQQRAMGIGWMTLEELSQAIPPLYTQWIGERLLEALA